MKNKQEDTDASGNIDWTPVDKKWMDWFKKKWGYKEKSKGVDNS